MKNIPNYYATLECTPKDDDDVIHRAYRRLAKRWHPDRVVAEEHARAEQMIRQLTEAYAVLSDPERRAEYDQSSSASPGNLYGTPFPLNYNYVPAHQPSPNSSTTSVGPNGASIVLGLVALLLAIASGTNAARSSGITQGILGIFFFVAGGFATVCFIQPEIIMQTLAPERLRQDANDSPQAPTEDINGFEELVRQVLDDLPEEFLGHMEHIHIIIEEEPGLLLLKRMGVTPGHILLGLYEGIPLTEQTSVYGNAMPERITLFQGPIERHCLFIPERIAHQVRATLLHELAHHFGIDHEQMPIWVKE